jgi:hypothetical protein
MTSDGYVVGIRGMDNRFKFEQVQHGKGSAAVPKQEEFDSAEGASAQDRRGVIDPIQVLGSGPSPKRAVSSVDVVSCRCLRG